MAEPLTREQQAEVLFILALLESQFGGVPALGEGSDGLYVVVPTCGCEKCQDFKKTYALKPRETVLAAAKAYGDDMLCQAQTLEALVKEGRVH